MMKLDDLGLSASRMIAGFAGGLVASFVIKEREPWAVVSSVVAGMLTANYLDDAVAHYVPSWVGQGGISFFTGLTAMAICQGLVGAVKARFAKAQEEHLDV